MTGLPLQHPEWFAAIASTLALVAVGSWFAFLRARRRLEILLGSGRAIGVQQAARDIALWLALLLIGLALLGPRVAQREVLLSGAGADVVILLDVSQSMDAADVAPSRLARARASLRRMLELLASGDRAALAAFAGRGVLFTPLTRDRDALAQMLPALDSRLIRPGGSDLRAGVQAAVTAFADGENRPRVILVLSDGEIDDRSGQETRREAERADARVIAVVLGSEAGARVPDRGAPLRDRSGEIVVSRRHTAGLERLTRATGGELFLADEWGEVDLARLVGAVDRDRAGASGDPIPSTRTVAMILPFAAGAALLLWLETLPRRRRRGLARTARTRTPTRQRVRRPGRVRAALLPLLLLPLAAGPTMESTRSHFDRGLAQAAARQQGAARQSFLAAVVLGQEPSLAALAHHNLGVLALERGDLEDARDSFLDSLALAPGDSRTRFNLEWTLRELARRPPPTTTLDANAPEQVEQREPETDDPPSESGDVRTSELRPLSAAERADWLGRVRDDPGRAMRAVAAQSRKGAGADARRGGPAW